MEKARKLIFGLGNPGRRYSRTRHNLGFEVVGCLSRRHGIRLGRGRFRCSQGQGEIDECPVVLIRPHTYVNLSGQTVAGAVRFYQLDHHEIMVICDDLNLDLGELRLRRSGSPGGHHGLESIIERLGTQEFPRLRIGIGNPPLGMEGFDYVLSRFPREEREQASEMIERAADAVEVWVSLGIEEAMNRFN